MQRNGSLAIDAKRPSAAMTRAAAKRDAAVCTQRLDFTIVVRRLALARALCLRSSRSSRLGSNCKAAVPVEEAAWKQLSHCDESNNRSSQERYCAKGQDRRRRQVKPSNPQKCGSTVQ